MQSIRNIPSHQILTAGRCQTSCFQVITKKFKNGENNKANKNGLPCVALAKQGRSQEDRGVAKAAEYMIQTIEYKKTSHLWRFFDMKKNDSSVRCVDDDTVFVYLCHCYFNGKVLCILDILSVLFSKML